MSRITLSKNTHDSVKCRYFPSLVISPTYKQLKMLCAHSGNYHALQSFEVSSCTKIIFSVCSPLLKIFQTGRTYFFPEILTRLAVGLIENFCLEKLQLNCSVQIYFCEKICPKLTQMKQN